MTEMYKILSGKYDTAVTSRLMKEHSYIMRGNDLGLEKNRSKYDLRKYFFINRVVNFGIVYLTTLSYATLLINLNPTLINTGNIVYDY